MLSDHGEGLGQHDEPTHGVLVYESTLRVPLIIRAPEGSGLRKKLPPGTAFEGPVGLVDIYDSVLDMLGIGMDHKTDGESFLDRIGRGPAETEIYYFESLYPRIAYRWSPLRGVRAGQWKYILAPQEELYHLADDPRELRNLAARDPEKARGLKDRLVSLAGSIEKESAPPGSRPSREEIRKLRALGYLSGGAGAVPAVFDTEGMDAKHIIAEFSGLMGAGEDAYAAGDLDGALENFTRIVELDPGNPQGRVFMARTLMMMGRLDEAAAEYTRVTQIDTTNSTPYFHLGNIAQGRGRLEKALAYYERALELTPGSPEALANIGSILIEKGFPDSAETVLREALKGDPENRVATLNLGLVYNSRGAQDEALEAFRRTIMLDPENVKAMANISAIYASRGLVDSTIRYLEMARQAGPGNAVILSNLGNAYRQKGLTGQAEECYREALLYDPDNVLSLFGLAAIRAGRGEVAEAEALLSRILTIKPDFAPARNALKNLSSQKTP